MVTSFFKKRKPNTTNKLPNWEDKFNEIAEKYEKSNRINQQKAIQEIKNLRDNYFLTPEEIDMLDQSYFNNLLDISSLVYSRPRIAEIMSGNKKDDMKIFVNKSLDGRFGTRFNPIKTRTRNRVKPIDSDSNIINDTDASDIESNFNDF